MQPNATSIQSLIERALEIALRQRICLIGSGRTDSGVHALGQVAHFSTERHVDPHRLLASLAGLLPLDIRVRALRSVPDEFHARFSATGKIYHYRIDRGKVLNPFTRRIAYHLPFPIDLSLLQKGAALFRGSHDFTSFSNEAHRGSAARDPIRNLTKLEIAEKGEELTLIFEGDGFLYKMVRNITGTLIDVARGKIPLEAIPKIFAAKDRSKAGVAAPAHGLTLMEVQYDQNSQNE